MQAFPIVTTAVPLVAIVLAAAPGGAPEARNPAAARPVISHFVTADRCISCHNGLVTPAGEDASIGVEWRASMMANSARDPYWQAGVRRETLDHPKAGADIEHECAGCHMPMARYDAVAAGARGQVFAHLPIGAQATAAGLLAADGVSCTLCHQIADVNLGSRESFVANFAIDSFKLPGGDRRVFGPFAIDPGRMRVMRSSSGFQPTEAAHVQRAEICASCHTLYTHALDPKGEHVGELPEQVPYLEWRHSAYRKEASCQVCHMPVVAEPMPLTSVLGQPRAGFSRHEFRGGNFFMPRVLNRFRAELGVASLQQELDAAAGRATDYLQTSAATVQAHVEQEETRLVVDVEVRNLAGHKLPTAYPSRRAWLHVTVRDREGKAIFESGRVGGDGRIAGNDNDDDPARYEPHYATISRPGQVQVYEAIMADHAGVVTTGLIAAVQYVKDNRLLPRGFDKSTAEPDIAVKGDAATDADFVGGADRVRYAVETGSVRGPFAIEVEFCYQPVGYRWAQNLKRYEAMETDRFTRYYDAMGPASMVVLARTTASTR